MEDFCTGHAPREVEAGRGERVAPGVVRQVLAFTGPDKLGNPNLALCQASSCLGQHFDSVPLYRWYPCRTGVL